MKIYIAKYIVSQSVKIFASHKYSWNKENLAFVLSREGGKNNNKKKPIVR